ncbi:MAG: RnfH family protein [Pseudomonadota bacterium]
MAPAETPLQVEVLYSPQAGQTESVSLSLPPGSTVAQALALSGLGERHPDVRDLLAPPAGAAVASTLACGVWGRRCALDQGLRDRDRVELYRPLRVDPKQARRERHAEHQRRHGKHRVVVPRSG